MPNAIRVQPAIAATLAFLAFAGCLEGTPTDAERGGSTSYGGPVRWDATDVQVARTRLGPESAEPINEPHVAVDPTDPRNVLAFAIDYTTPDLDPRVFGANVAFRSQDGGATWAELGLMDYTGPDQLWDSGDPVVLFAADGTAHYSSLAKGPDGVGGIWHHRSMDGGATWEAPVLAVDREPAAGKCPRPDKQWIAIDALTGDLHLVYTDFVFDCEEVVDDPAGVGGFVAYDQASIKLTTSTDGGLTWSPLQVVHDGYAVGAIPAVTPDGALVVATWGATATPHDGSCPGIAVGAASGLFLEPRPFEAIIVATTRDGGRTWTEHEVGTCNYELSYLTKAGTVNAMPQPTMAVDPRSGHVTVVFPRFLPAEDRFGLFAITSGDGASWSEPAEIGPGEGDLHFPTMVAGADGTLRLAFIATYAGDDTGLALYMESTDDGRTWSEPFALSTQPMDLSDDPDLGHYIGISEGGDRVTVVWADAREQTTVWSRSGSLASIG